MKNIEFNGGKYTTKNAEAFSIRRAKSDGELQKHLNIGAIGIADHGNPDYLNTILSGTAFRLKSGDLNAAGKEAFAYVRAHCPKALWDKETMAVKVKKAKKGSPLHNALAVPFSDDGEGRARLVPTSETQKFALSITAWRTKAAQRAPSSPELKATKATTAGKAIDKLIAQLDAGKVEGSAEELGALMVQVAELQAALASAGVKAPAKGEGIDTDAAAMVETGAHKGKAPAAQRRADNDGERQRSIAL